MISPTDEIPAIVRFAVSHARIQTNVCSHQKHDHGYLLERRTVPDYNLIFVTRGAVAWVVDGCENKLEDGDLLLVPPGVPHHGHSLTPRITLISIHVEASLPGGRDVFTLLNPPSLRRVERRTRLDHYLRGAAEEWRRPDQTIARQMLTHWTHLIVPEMILHDARRRTLNPRPLDAVVSDMLEKLPARIDRPTTLVELAGESGYTPQHLNRLFRRSLGVTPLQYLARLRMERAASLLADGRYSVAGVARQVGFEDPYYFSRLFKQHFGRPPAQYREAAGSNSPSAGSPSPFKIDGPAR